MHGTGVDYYERKNKGKVKGLRPVPSPTLGLPTTMERNVDVKQRYPPSNRGHQHVHVQCLNRFASTPLPILDGQIDPRHYYVNHVNLQHHLFMLILLLLLLSRKG